MHRMDPSLWQHDHDYLPRSHVRGERQTRRVIALTATMVVADIISRDAGSQSMRSGPGPA